MRVFTKEEIRELFSENNKAIAETNRGIFELKERQKKTEEAIDRLAASQKKTDETIDRLAASQKKTDETIDRLAASQKKTDEQIAKTAKQLAKTDTSLKRLGKRYGGLSNNVGEATEELFFNMLNHERVLNGIRFDSVQRNWHDRVGNFEDEYDIVMRNGSSIFILESKFKPTKSDVEKLLTTKQENFNILFPEYKDYDQHWGLAATIIDEELKDMAVNNGLTVLQYKGGLLVTPPSNASVIV